MQHPRAMTRCDSYFGSPRRAPSRSFASSEPTARVAAAPIPLNALVIKTHLFFNDDWFWYFIGKCKLGKLQSQSPAFATLWRGSLRLSLRCGRKRPKMTIGKCMTGTAFEVTLETLRLLKRFKCNIDFQLPRCKLGRVNTSAGIVFKQTLLQVRGVSNIAMLRTAKAFNDVGVKHHAKLPGMACHPQLGTVIA